MQSETRQHLAAELKETGRIEAFSDGVFAIAITLLVLDLRLPAGSPDASEREVWGQLFALLPRYLAFVLSFAFIGIMWINHHRLFTHITRSDNTLLYLNLLLLLGVTIVPFPTVVLADHLGSPGDRPAALVYNGLFIAISIFFNVLWRYASSGNRLISKNADAQQVARITRQYMGGPLFYLAAFAAALVSTQLSIILDLILAVFFALPGPRVETKLPY